MVADAQLSRDFWLHEAPCWQKATAAQVEALRETAARVLQPTRNQWGRLKVTSWIWWSAGCIPRTGAHAQGGTVDFVSLDAPLLDVWEWGNSFLMPAGYIGKWIYEPQTATQGEHIHIAPRADMLAYNGDGRIQALKELPDGRTYVYMDWTEGTFAAPFQLDPLVVTATPQPAQAGGSWWWTLLGLGLLATALTRSDRGRWLLDPRPS